MIAPVEQKVTRYLCPFCRRGHSQKRAAAEHIERCWCNPEVRACKGCVHYDPPCCRGGSPECGCGGRWECVAPVQTAFDVAAQEIVTDCPAFVALPHFAAAAQQAKEENP